MSRQLENLKRLFEKMQSRYGPDDDIVSQFRQEVASRESAESGLQDFTAAGPRGTPGSAALRRRDFASRQTSSNTPSPWC
jgi:hypothetical protein